MVPGSNIVRLLTKLPVPVPSVVLELAMVGFVAVAQQTPLAVTDAPPSAVILPPEVAVVTVIPVIAVVVRVGTATEVVIKVKSLP